MLQVIGGLAAILALAWLTSTKESRAEGRAWAARHATIPSLCVIALGAFLFFVYPLIT